MNVHFSIYDFMNYDFICVLLIGLDAKSHKLSRVTSNKSNKSGSGTSRSEAKSNYASERKSRINTLQSMVHYSPHVRLKVNTNSFILLFLLYLIFDIVFVCKFLR